MSQSYLLFDPQHPQAVALMQTLYHRYQLRAVCLYPSRERELEQRPLFPMLRSNMVEASYLLDSSSLTHLAHALRQRHDLVGMVPHQEISLERAASFLELLELPWNDPSVLRRARDRFAVKDYLRNQHPRLPVTETRAVRSADEVFAEPLPERFVLKPRHAGQGVRAVRFFSADTPRAQVAAYFVERRGPAVLEEVLEGTEYAVYGQLDHGGYAEVAQVVLLARDAGRLLTCALHVPRTDAAFSSLVTYATQVTEALQLRRTPFVANLMLTPHGPRLIDLSVRLSSPAEASMINTAHGGDFDALALSGHYYLKATPAVDAHLDWTHYDRIRSLHFNGLGPREARVYRVAGLREVEMMPEFTRWIARPQVGDKLQRMAPGASAPSLAYAVQLRTYGAQQDLLVAREHVQRLVQINQQVSGTRRFGVGLAATLRALRRRGRVWAAQAWGA